MPTTMKTTLVIPEQKTPHFAMQAVTITSKQDLSSLKKNLSTDDLATFLLAYKLALESCKRALTFAKDLFARYPHHPEILNLMSYLYLARRKLRKADKLIAFNYIKNPEYLLGKINYADACLRKGKIDEIPKIFKKTFDLRLIVPTRRVFHLSEYRGFMVVMSFYQLALKNKEAAEAYFYLAYTVDKSHPSVEILKKKLYRKPFAKWLFFNR